MFIATRSFGITGKLNIVVAKLSLSLNIQLSQPFFVTSTDYPKYLYKIRFFVHARSLTQQKTHHSHPLVLYFKNENVRTADLRA